VGVVLGGLAVMVGMSTRRLLPFVVPVEDVWPLALPLRRDARVAFQLPEVNAFDV